MSISTKYNISSTIKPSINWISFNNGTLLTDSFNFNSHDLELNNSVGYNYHKNIDTSYLNKLLYNTNNNYKQILSYIRISFNKLYKPNKYILINSNCTNFITLLKDCIRHNMIIINSDDFFNNNISIEDKQENLLCLMKHKLVVIFHHNNEHNNKLLNFIEAYRRNNDIKQTNLNYNLNFGLIIINQSNLCIFNNPINCIQITEHNDELLNKVFDIEQYKEKFMNIVINH